MTARIKVSHHEQPFGHRTTTYEWEGPLDGRVFLDYRTARAVPWPLRPVKRETMSEGWFIRTDVRHWRLTAARYALWRAWEWFTVRAVLTLYVWGLARRSEGARPSWRDVGRPKP